MRNGAEMLVNLIREMNWGLGTDCCQQLPDCCERASTALLCSVTVTRSSVSSPPCHQCV